MSRKTLVVLSAIWLLLLVLGVFTVVNVITPRQIEAPAPLAGETRSTSPTFSGSFAVTSTTGTSTLLSLQNTTDRSCFVSETGLVATSSTPGALARAQLYIATSSLSAGILTSGGATNTQTLVDTMIGRTTAPELSGSLASIFVSTDTPAAPGVISTSERSNFIREWRPGERMNFVLDRNSTTTLSGLGFVKCYLN